MADADPRPRPSRWIRRVAWSIFAGTAVLTLGYGALVLRVAMLEPSIAIDSIARLRELQGLEGGELVATGGTWPIYIEALEVTEEGSVFSRELETVPGAPAGIVPERTFAGMAMAVDVDELINIAKGGNPAIEPEVVEQARAWVVAYFEPRMAQLRAAAREGPLGLRPVERPSGPQAVLYGGGVQRDLPYPAWVLEIPDPPHFLLRGVAEVFEIDARVAAARGDGQRAVESIKGILEIAEQLSESWDSTAALYALGTRSEADHLAAELLAAHPEAFGERDLARLEAALATRGLAEMMEKSLARTKILVDDTLQHWYSDDGDGDGRILPHVMLSLIDIGATSAAAERFLSLVVTPVAVMRAPTRAEVAAEMEDALARIRADIALPPWRRDPDDAKAKATAASKASSIRPLAISAQEVTVRFEPVMRLARDRSLLAIAIERFHRANGRGPRALTELVPAFLPAVPVDPVTGVAYRSRIAEDGAIEVWSVGRDGVDDGGVFLADARELGRIPPSPWWRALHEFRAQHGRFPADQAELASVLASEVPLPKSVEYRLEDGVPMLRAIAEPGADVSVVRVPPAAEPAPARDAAPDP